MTTHADVSRAITPVLAGTAFDPGPDREDGGHPLWCVPTDEFRRRHPGLPEAVDHEHPDGCTDLGVYLRDGLLERASIEMLDVAPDLEGRPIDDVLPELVDRIDRLLR